MPSKLNAPTREITIVNVDDHPIFNRLWGKEGFVRVNEENLEEFKSAKGLVLIFFADNPTTFKETIDMAVIAPKLLRCSRITLPQRASLTLPWAAPSRAVSA